MTSKARLNKRKTDLNQKNISELPMNKLFMAVTDKEGKLVYPLAERIWKWKLSGIDKSKDIMRQICAFVDSIRSYQCLTRRYESEVSSGKITSKTKDGDLMDVIDLDTGIKANRINQYRSLANIRDLVTNQLMAMIDNEGFTGDIYNNYVLKLSKVLNELGFDLFPDEFEIIYPE